MKSSRWTWHCLTHLANVIGWSVASLPSSTAMSNLESRQPARSGRLAHDALARRAIAVGRRGPQHSFETRCGNVRRCRRTHTHAAELTPQVGVKEDRRAYEEQQQRPWGRFARNQLRATDVYLIKFGGYVSPPAKNRRGNRRFCPRLQEAPSLGARPCRPQGDTCVRRQERAFHHSFAARSR